MLRKLRRLERVRRQSPVQTNSSSSSKALNSSHRLPSVKPPGPTQAFQAARGGTTVYSAETKLDTSTSLPPGTAESAIQQLKLSTSVCCLPHPDKAHYGGEDAYFTSDVGGGAIGLADGVGGWQDSGVNPADYSKAFMRIAKAYLEGKDILSVAPTPMVRSSIGGGSSTTPRFRQPAPKLPDGGVDPRGALEAAHNFTRLAGSSTACVVQLDKSKGALVAANVGDSGFIVVRNGQVVVQSRPLEHYFDCPLQFGAFPEFVEATDTPADADIYNIPVQPGDVIIAGTDGLWDNCYLQEIVPLAPRSPEGVAASATAIAQLARKHASDAEFDSPYIKEALSHGYDLPFWEKLMGIHFKHGRLHLKRFTGGKMDDITVIVSVVMPDEQAPEPAPEPAVAQAPEAVIAPTASAGHLAVSDVDDTDAVADIAAASAEPQTVAERVVSNVTAVRAASGNPRQLNRWDTPLAPNMQAAEAAMAEAEEVRPAST